MVEAKDEGRGRRRGRGSIGVGAPLREEREEEEEVRARVFEAFVLLRRTPALSFEWQSWCEGVDKVAGQSFAERGRPNQEVKYASSTSSCSTKRDSSPSQAGRQSALQNPIGMRDLNPLGTVA